jgi:hypothetical protein
MAEPANDQLDWDIEVKDGDVWIIGDEMLNLGPKDLVFSKLADAMAADDFGERA